MWTQDMFGVEKPIIALLHLDALPGDPGSVSYTHLTLPTNSLV